MILITCWDLHCYVVHPTATERTDIPPLTLEDMEVVRQEISEKYFTQPPEISTPLHVFFGLPKEVGGVLRMSDFSPGLSRFSETESYCCNGISGVVASRAVKYNGPWFCTSPPQKVLKQSLGRGKKMDIYASAGLHAPDHIHRCPLLHN